jgi:dTDP-4-dehydrorhamnose reductase
VDPINAYGRSKLLGEQLALNNNPNSLVVRTSWLMSATHDNFVSTILRMAGDAGSEVRVVADQAGCPTIAGDLAVAALTAMNNRVTGLLHLVNGPATTWFDLARFAVACARLPGTVVPCTTAEFPRPAVRPVNSVLASERLRSWPSILLPSWHDSIPLVVDAQMKRIPSGG